MAPKTSNWHSIHHLMFRQIRCVTLVSAMHGTAGASFVIPPESLCGLKLYRPFLGPSIRITGEDARFTLDWRRDFRFREPFSPQTLKKAKTSL
jgi:hypothetical protein